MVKGDLVNIQMNSLINGGKASDRALESVEEE